MTKEPKLLLTVANHFYTDVKGEYVVLAVDSTKLTSAVKFEPAADVGDKKSDGLDEGEAEPVLFPHLVRGPTSLTSWQRHQGPGPLMARAIRDLMHGARRTHTVRNYRLRRGDGRAARGEGSRGCVPLHHRARRGVVAWPE